MTPRIDISFDGCVGVFHPAAGTQGAIICAGYGYDELCTYRNFALLADDLAEAGVPTLRFDYHGTGNSLGADEEPDRIETWLHNITTAIDWMRREARIEEITLIGYRLGGLLATTAAARRPEVRRLVLIAPVISGRSHIRELQLQSQLYPVADDAKGDDAGVSVAGFRLSAQTIAELKPRNLAKDDLPSLDQVLILADGLTPDTPLVQALAERGAAVKCLSFPAISELTVDPIRSLAVHAPFASIVPFLARPILPTPAEASPLEVDATLATPEWSETRCRFGPQDRLFGIYCVPAGKPAGKTLLLVNGGANRNIGWARLTVRLARTLAKAGIASLRIDFEGLGESLAPQKGQRPLLYADAFQTNVAMALDWLDAHHTGTSPQQVIALGACSGAQTLFNAAIADDRLNALVMVNLLRFDVSPQEAAGIGGAPTFRSTANYLERIRDRQAWKRLFRGGRRKLSGLTREYARRGAIAARSHLGFSLFRVTKNAAFGGATFRKFALLARRGTRICIIYSDVDDGLGELAIHVGQEGRMVETLGGVKFALIGATDHNLTSRVSQDTLIALVETFAIEGV